MNGRRICHYVALAAQVSQTLASMDTSQKYTDGGMIWVPWAPEPQPGWRLVVSPDAHGHRLDRFISDRLERITRARASKLAVYDAADWQPLKKSARVKSLQEIVALRPIPDSCSEMLSPPRVLYENEKWVVLNKPAGWAVHPTASYFRRTIAYWFATQSQFNAVPTHRLDVETSGYLLCSRTKASASLGAELFAKGQLSKSYLAVAQGVSELERWEINVPLGFDVNSEIPIKMGPGALSATTRFEVIERFHGSMLLLAMPKGGRQHQIRVHAWMSGFPLIGDKLYGQPDSVFLEKHARTAVQTKDLLGHWRHALHALSILHTELPIGVYAPLPGDWSEFLPKAYDFNIDDVMVKISQLTD